MTALTCEDCGHTGEDVVPHGLHGYWGDYCEDAQLCRGRMPAEWTAKWAALDWLDAHEDEYREAARNVAVGLFGVACLAMGRSVGFTEGPGCEDGGEFYLRAAGLGRE